MPIPEIYAYTFGLGVVGAWGGCLKSLTGWLSWKGWRCGICCACSCSGGYVGACGGAMGIPHLDGAPGAAQFPAYIGLKRIRMIWKDTVCAESVVGYVLVVCILSISVVVWVYVYMR
jgi:hypothetical protein